MTLQRNCLDQVAEKYDAFLIDQFGVLLDSRAAYTFAPDALKRLAATGKRILLLSNSGRRSAQNHARLVDFGFAPDSFEMVLTSGEVAFREIKSRIGKTIKYGAKVFVVTRDEDTSSTDGLPLVRTNTPSQADLIILAGNKHDGMQLEAYQDLLQVSATHGVPCICTNPDMELLLADGLTFNSGRIAQLYEKMGGHVEWIGKPYPMIYDRAWNLMGRPEHKRVLCIGDSLAHDIKGGNDFGFSTALVLSGLQALLGDDKIEASFDEVDTRPDHILQQFSFT